MDAHAYTSDDGRLLEELGWVRRIADRLLLDPNDADDLVQEAWLKTRDVCASFESRGRLRAWLAGMVRRMARDTLRARRRRAAREERVAREAARAVAEDGVERIAALESLLQAVRALDERQRSTVLLRYLDGYSTAEIAVAMSVSEELVRKRLSRARAHLRGTLNSQLGYVRSAARARRAARRGASIAIALALLALGARALWPRTPEPEHALAQPAAPVDPARAPDGAEPRLAHTRASSEPESAPTTDAARPAHDANTPTPNAKAAVSLGQD